MFIYKIIIIIIISVNHIESRNDCLDDSNVLIDFNKFQELNFTNCKIFKTSTQALTIQPSKPIILDNSLNFTGLTIELKYGHSITFNLYNLKGIDLESNPFSTLKTIPNNLNLGYFD